MRSFKTGLVVLTTITFLSGAATIAQQDVGTGGTTTVATEDDRPNYLPLLGLLGLLGLMGLKRRDHTHAYTTEDRR